MRTSADSPRAAGTAPASWRTGAEMALILVDEHPADHGVAQPATTHEARQIDELHARRARARGGHRGGVREQGAPARQRAGPAGGPVRGDGAADAVERADADLRVVAHDDD